MGAAVRGRRSRPLLPGVYMARERADGEVVYVGMAAERRGRGWRGGVAARLGGPRAGAGSSRVITRVSPSSSSMARVVSATWMVTVYQRWIRPRATFWPQTVTSHISSRITRWVTRSRRIELSTAGHRIDGHASTPGRHPPPRRERCSSSGAHDRCCKCDARLAEVSLGIGRCLRERSYGSGEAASVHHLSRRAAPRGDPSAWSLVLSLRARTEGEQLSLLGEEPLVSGSRRRSGTAAGRRRY